MNHTLRYQITVEHPNRDHDHWTRTLAEALRYGKGWPQLGALAVDIYRIDGDNWDEATVVASWKRGGTWRRS